MPTSICKITDFELTWTNTDGYGLSLSSEQTFDEKRTDTVPRVYNESISIVQFSSTKKNVFIWEEALADGDRERLGEQFDQASCPDNESCAKETPAQKIASVVVIRPCPTPAFTGIRRPKWWKVVPHRSEWGRSEIPRAVRSRIRFSGRIRNHCSTADMGRPSVSAHSFLVRGLFRDAARIARDYFRHGI